MRLISAIRTTLARAGDPAKAAGQQRYMKSAMPFYGVAVPEVRKIVRQLAKERPIGDEGTWGATIRVLWTRASHREERYAALALARLASYRQWATQADTLPLWQDLVLSAQWWDLCDEISHLTGGVLAAHPETAAELRAWSRHENLWVRRVAVLSQLRFKADTDAELLAYCIEGSITDADFFARKGVGWALREYSKTDPEWVGGFIAEHPGLSPLSVREGSKYLAT